MSRTRTKVIPIPVMGRTAINAYLLLGRRPVIVDAAHPAAAGRSTTGSPSTEWTPARSR